MSAMELVPVLLRVSCLPGERGCWGAGGTCQAPVGWEEMAAHQSWKQVGGSTWLESKAKFKKLSNCLWNRHMLFERKQLNKIC